MDRRQGAALRPLMSGAVFGFVVIGLVSIGCITFGAYEIATANRIFLNDGLGEILTILGLYFTTPYLFCLGIFVVVIFDLGCCGFLRQGHRFVPATFIIIFVMTLVTVQQAITDRYLTILFGNWALLIVALDVGVIGAILFLGLSPASGYLYTCLYALKMGLQWGRAYVTKDQPFFGPNGMVANLFMCIPIIQLPLYTSTLARRGELASTGEPGAAAALAAVGSTFIDVFVSNFNLFLSHLLHSLDIISMFLFAFVPPVATAENKRTPTPFRWLIGVFMLLAFIANNCSLLHLFYQRIGDIDAEIPFLPKRIREASRRSDEADDNVQRSHHRRMFQYFLLMLVVCDFPFLVSRFELWRQSYAPLDIFIAKNLKDLCDVFALLLRTEKQRERLALD